MANVADYEEYLLSKGVSLAVQNVSHVSLSRDATNEWYARVLDALKEEPELLAIFFSFHSGRSFEEALELFDNPESIKASINKGHEALLDKTMTPDVWGSRVLHNMEFQLDAKTATLLGERTLEAGDAKTRGRSILSLSPLNQKNLPNEIADQILTTYPHKTHVPLSAWRFSEEKLTQIASEADDGRVPTYVQITNPYLSDEAFENILKSSPLVYPQLWNQAELSPQRWAMVWDKMVSDGETSRSFVLAIAQNASLPYEVARKIFDARRANREIPYGGDNMELVLSQEMAGVEFDPESAIVLCKAFTTSEQLIRYWNLHDKSFAAGQAVIHNPLAPASLIEEVMSMPDSKFMYPLDSFLYQPYKEPSLWSLRTEYRAYLEPNLLGSFSRKKFESRINEVLIKHNWELSHIQNTPVSWKMEIVELLIAENKAAANSGC